MLIFLQVDAKLLMPGSARLLMMLVAMRDARPQEALSALVVAEDERFVRILNLDDHLLCRWAGFSEVFPGQDGLLQRSGADKDVPLVHDFAVACDASCGVLVLRASCRRRRGKRPGFSCYFLLEARENEGCLAKAVEPDVINALNVVRLVRLHSELSLALAVVLNQRSPLTHSRAAWATGTVACVHAERSVAAAEDDSQRWHMLGETERVCFELSRPHNATLLRHRT
mmetsp:Transcript_54880/g.119724  ORF Transcript_54880/g.119724 Transcript_54880/m.119724 type:complete len:227 (-) Transcript_54880:303-983(-)